MIVTIYYSIQGTFPAWVALRPGDLLEIDGINYKVTAITSTGVEAARKIHVREREREQAEACQAAPPAGARDYSL